MPEQMLSRAFRLRDPLSIAAFIFLAIAGVAALAAPWLPLSDPNAIDAVHRLEMPSPRHPLGTDNLGRDLLSRIIWGARWSLGAVTMASALIVFIGVSLGIIAGYFGGLIEEVLMRVVDVFFALPSLLLALAIGGILGPGFSSVLFALAGVWWAGYARLVRGLVVSMRDRDFLVAARALGAGNWHVIRLHLLPNVFPTVVVLATIEMGDLVLAVAALGFLGVGVQAPNPEWGTMISDARAFLLSKPMLVVWPGLMITLTVVAFNLVGDGLRDSFDSLTSSRESPGKETPPALTTMPLPVR
ncbi:MAG: ABC transporter permease subunit [Gemmatimonadota bacterium]|nr:ABC transporter permease subunit [Gemmatimonadota bacterium]